MSSIVNWLRTAAQVNAKSKPNKMAMWLLLYSQPLTATIRDGNFNVKYHVTT